MAKRKAKVTNHSAAPVEAPKKDQWEEYLNLKAMQLAPANGEFKKRLAIKLVEWVDLQTEPSMIEEFCLNQGILRRTYTRWLDTCPELREAHEYAKERLAVLRIKNGTNGKWKWDACRWALPFFGAHYLQHEKDLAATKQEDKSADVKVTIEEIPSSSEVPNKK